MTARNNAAATEIMFLWGLMVSDWRDSNLKPCDQLIRWRKCERTRRATWKMWSLTRNRWPCTAQDRDQIWQLQQKQINIEKRWWYNKWLTNKQETIHMDKVRVLLLSWSFCVCPWIKLPLVSMLRWVWPREFRTEKESANGFTKNLGEKKKRESLGHPALGVNDDLDWSHKESLNKSNQNDRSLRGRRRYGRDC